MWIQRTKKIAFIANPRTASREIAYEVLKLRGFGRFCGHHGVPWGPDYPRPRHFEKDGEFWSWYNEVESEWTWYAGHRNHFEVFHSIFYAALGGHPASPERFENYLWRHHALYRRGSGFLFPSFWEIRECQEIRFDHMREDVDAMLRRHELPPLRDHELQPGVTEHVTGKKPRGEHYSFQLDDACREWIEEKYAHELERFGYAWKDPQEGTLEHAHREQMNA